MKHILTAICAFLILLPSRGALLFHDSFLSGTTPANGEYASGADLGGANPTVAGFSGAWSASDAGELLTTSSGLTYSNGSISLGAGGAVTQGNTTFDETASLRNATTSDSFTGAGDYWFAALFKADSDNGSLDRLELNIGIDSGSSVSISMGIRDLAYYASGATLTPNITDGDVYTPGSTALIIAQAVVTGTGGGTDETVNFWINPSDTSSLSALNTSAEATATANTGLVFGNWGAISTTISVSSSANQGRMVDEIMAGDSLSDLNTALIPEPSSLLLLLGALGAAGIFARRRR